MEIKHKISPQNVKDLSVKEEQYHRIFNSIPAMIAYIDTTLRYHYVNAAFEEFIGKKKKEIIGRSVLEVLGEEAYEQLKKNIASVLNGHTVNFEREMTFSGINHFMEVTLTPDFDVYGNVKGYTVFANNITEQKYLFKKLAESEHRYRELIEKLPVAIYTCDANGRIEMYNQAAANLWGRAPEIGKDMWCGSWRIYKPNGESLPLDGCPMAVTLKEGRPVYGEEIVVERPDGIRLNVAPFPQPIFDSAGSVTGAINMLVDITDRKKAEESNAKLAAIVQSSDDAIISKTLEGIVTSWNDSASRMFGYSPEEMIGESILKLIPPDRIDEEPHILQRLKKGERVDHFETERITKDGKRINVSLTISPVKDSKGRIIGISKIARDITEQKNFHNAIREAEENFRMELEKQVAEKTEKLKLANSRLEKSNHELERFAYVASHDLQEPLRKIQAFGDLILERNGNEFSSTGKDYLARMIKSANRMQSLIEALLEFSRATTPQKNFEKKNLNTLANEVKKEFQEVIEEKNVILNISALPVIPVIPFQFKQMLSNIISNALKYAKPNEISVINITAHVVSGKDINKNGIKTDIEYCDLTVQDNGIGFDKENAERIFELFQRLHGRHEYNGSGIGLSICKKIAENHGGFIIAEGEKGKGAAFHIYIPTQQN